MSRFRPSFQPTQAVSYIPPAVATPSNPVLPTPVVTSGWIRPNPAVLTPAGDSSVDKVLLSLFGVYLFLHVCWASEVFITFFHFYFPLVFVLAVILPPLVFVTGRAGRFFSTPFATPWILLLLWYYITSVFGTYPRRSLTFMLGYGIRYHILIAIFFCAICLNPKHTRTLMYYITAGLAAALAVAFRYGDTVDERFTIPGITLANPNDLAFHVLLFAAMSLILLFRKSLFARMSVCVLLPFAILVALKTGSRANFLTLLLIGVVLLWVLPARGKIALLAVSVVGGLLAIVVVPSSTLARLATIGGTRTSNSGLLGNAVDSENARSALQKAAVALTIRHPLFGVGPNMFEDAVEDMFRESGLGKSGWQFPHNVYLEVSSECGLPGMFLYIWMIVLCLRENYRGYMLFRGRGDSAELGGQSLCLFLSSAVFGFGILFCNVAFMPYLPFLVGFSASNYMNVNGYFSRPATSPV